MIHLNNLMPRSLHFIRFLSVSFVLHATGLIALYIFLVTTAKESPLYMPVNVVSLPPEAVRKLPPVEQRPPVKPAPEKITPPYRGAVPVPKKFGTSEEIKLPKTAPAPPPAGEQGTGKGAGKAKPGTGPGTSPLPFLSQADIDQLARKGMPPQKPGDESVTLDTDEFKFMSYNRWLKAKVEGTLVYPELAAASGYQGVLYIKFDILKDGSLGDLELLKSSGYKILDDEALRAIRASAPFASLPDDWHMERYSIRAAVIFYLSTAYIR